LLIGLARPVSELLELISYSKENLLINLYALAKILFLTLIFAWWIQPSQAQPANEFAVWGGGSFRASTLIGKTEDARLGVLGLRYTRLLTEKKNLSLKYTIDALPAIVLNYSQTQLEFRVINNTPALVRRTVDYTVYG
jgi:hypothetical protein